MTRPPVDPIALSRELIRRPSVTPADAGAMDIVQSALEDLGFLCRRMRFGEIENLYARWGTHQPNLCFAGHTDVVPVGDAKAWTHDPFAAAVEDGVLVGRGAADMKSAIAAFIAAAGQAIADGAAKGSLSLLITGDEEGVAEYGTRAVVEALAAEGEVIDHCVVGEPTSSQALGDMIKIGRRGSIIAQIVVEGTQGHVAYPHRAANPLPPMIRFLSAVQSRVLDDGYEGFEPSNLEVTTVDVGNPASNVIPARATARLNIRFNPAHTGASLSEWLQAEATAAGDGFPGRVVLTTRISGEAFLTARGRFTDVVASAVAAETGVTPELSTTGGTSDARFIRVLCPVVEFGLVGASMHKVDEQVPVADVMALARVYRRIIGDYFEAFAEGASVIDRHQI
jgi:succinyl-diaminopimelate desuccinylase